MPLLPEGELRVARCDLLDKLIRVGDGDAALLYLYILRHGDGAEESQVIRALRMTHARYEKAMFTLTDMTTVSVAPSDSADKPPAYTAEELRRTRTDDHQFSAVCAAAEDTLGRALTEAQLRCLLTAYDHLGLSAGAIIELLSHLKREKGTVRLADIRHEAFQWADLGITSATAAQQYLARRADEKPLTDAVLQALGCKEDKPAPKAQRVCAFALAQGFPAEAVALAVQRTEHKQGHMSYDYVLGILRAWDQKGVHTVSEITALEPETRAAVGQTLSQPTSPKQLEIWEADWAARVRNHQKQSEE